MLMTGISILFYMTGLLQDCSEGELCEGVTPNSLLMQVAMTPERFSDLEFNAQLLLVFEGIAAAGISIGLFFAGRPDLAIMGPFAVFMLNLGLDFLHVYLKVRESSDVIAVIIFGPLFVLFAITVLEFWRGKD